MSPITDEKNRMSIDTDEGGKVGIALNNAYASRDVEIGMIQVDDDNDSKPNYNANRNVKRGQNKSLINPPSEAQLTKLGLGNSGSQHLQFQQQQQNSSRLSARRATVKHAPPASMFSNTAMRRVKMLQGSKEDHEGSQDMGSGPAVIQQPLPNQSDKKDAKFNKEGSVNGSIQRTQTELTQKLTAKISMLER